MVDLSIGFKMGIVMFVGETEFAPGEKIGVALDGPYGKSTAHVTLHLSNKWPFISSRQEQRHREGCEVLQVQGETRCLCPRQQDHPTAWLIQCLPCSQ